MLESYEDFAEFISKRIAQLRIQKNIPAREMSLSLGLGAAYINHIENKNNMPSMEGLYDICEFLGISPKDFFDEESEAPLYFWNCLKRLNDSMQKHYKSYWN